MNAKQYKELALDSGIQTNQIWTNYDEFCIPCLSSIHLAVLPQKYFHLEMITNS